MNEIVLLCIIVNTVYCRDQQRSRQICSVKIEFKAINSNTDNETTLLNTILRQAELGTRILGNAVGRNHDQRLVLRVSLCTINIQT